MYNYLLPLLICFLQAGLAVAQDASPPGIPFPAVDTETGPTVPAAIDIPAGPAGQSLNGKVSVQPDIAPNGPQAVALPSVDTQPPLPRQRGASKRSGTNKRRHSPGYGSPYADAGGGQGFPHLGPAGGGGVILKTRPGVTEEAVIAQGKLNRIVTPFLSPKVLTADAVETKVDGSAVYVATDTDAPVSLFITDTDTGGAASLQLIPQALGSPVEIQVVPEQGKGPDSTGTDAGAGSRLYKQDSPYITEVKAIMQALGKQRVPVGFSLVESGEAYGYTGICHGLNLTFRLGQVLKGPQSEVIVYIAENRGLQAAQFEESFCASDSTVAVAAWPRVRLAPGERTEVYVLVHQPEDKSGEVSRPALL